MSESVDFINAAENGDLNTVQSLVDKVNINSKDEGGYTALYNAAYKGHLDVVRFLVARKDVDVNLADVRTQKIVTISLPSLLPYVPQTHYPVVSLSLSTTTLFALCMTSSFPLPISLCIIFGCRRDSCPSSLTQISPSHSCHSMMLSITLIYTYMSSSPLSLIFFNIYTQL